MRDKMKKEKVRLKKLLAIVTMLVALVAVSAPLTVRAERELPDLDKKGSISISFQYEGKALSGGTVSLYTVALAEENDGDYAFVYTNGFEDCGIDLGDLKDSSLAGKLEEKISKTTKSTSKEVGESGKVEFTDLKPGVYLIKQTEESSAYKTISSFLVSIPQKGESKDGKYSYDIDATPKMEVEAKPTTTPSVTPSTTPSVTPSTTPSVTPTTTPSVTPSKPVTTITPTTTPTVIPKTGQLDWPIPILAMTGLALILIGCYLKGDKSEKDLPKEK